MAYNGRKNPVEYPQVCIYIGFAQVLAQTEFNYHREKYYAYYSRFSARKDAKKLAFPNFDAAFSFIAPHGSRYAGGN